MSFTHPEGVPNPDEGGGVAQEPLTPPDEKEAEGDEDVEIEPGIVP